MLSEWSLIRWILYAAIALLFDVIAEIHAHVGDGCILLLVLLGLHVVAAAGEGEEDGWGYWGQVLVVEGY